MAQPEMEQIWCLALPGEPCDLSILPHFSNRICSDFAQSSE